MRRLVALAALAAASFPVVAAADDSALSAGVYVSFTFGKQLGVGYGLDTSMIGLVADEAGSCDGGKGVGGALQLGGINGSTFRMVAAAQGGGQVDSVDSVGFAGELGFAAHLAAKKPGIGLHTGLLVDTSRFANIFARQEWFLEEYSVGAGARFPGTFGFPGCAVVGRPLRGGGGEIVVPPEVAIAAAHDDERGSLAAAWASDAAAECASIPAFLQLALDLLACGAPETLVERALAAAEDETRHAAACGAMASRWLAAPCRPSLPGAPLQVRTPGPELMRRLAIESWLDGALNEGDAAARASRASMLATDPLARRIQLQIGHDEARHADLGWRVLAWALDRGGAVVAEQVRAHRDVDAGMPIGASLDSDLGLRHGRLDAGACAAITERHVARSRVRLDAMLSA